MSPALHRCLLAACVATCAVPVMAQDTLWKCGNLFTDRPQARAGQPCTPATDTSFAAAMPRTSREPAPQAGPAARVSPATQDARDRDARGIVQAELARTLARRETLVATESRTPPAAYADELRRIDSDIESLRREIARLPQETP